MIGQLYRLLEGSSSRVSSVSSSVYYFQIRKYSLLPQRFKYLKCIQKQRSNLLQAVTRLSHIRRPQLPVPAEIPTLICVFRGSPQFFLDYFLFNLFKSIIQYHRNVRCCPIEHNLLSTSLNKQQNTKIKRTNTSQETKNKFLKGALQISIMQKYCIIMSQSGRTVSMGQKSVEYAENAICWLLCAVHNPMSRWYVGWRRRILVADPSRNPGVLLRGERESFLSTGKSREI